MAQTKLVYYLEEDGTVPIIEWLDSLPSQSNYQMPRVSRPAGVGRTRIAKADYLRDGIQELRPSLAGVHYRILYFFHGSEAVVVSHGLTKERNVSKMEIERSIQRMKRFRSNPPNHTFTPAKGK